MGATPKIYLALNVAAVGLALVVVLLGAWTRLVDAGLGCPDWPGCYGQIGIPDTPAEIARAKALFPDNPPEPDKAQAEMTHRYVAGGLGLLIFALGGLAFYAKRRSAFVHFPLALTLVVLVSAQATAGALTVTLLLWPQIVTLHLLGGFLTLALLVVLLARLVSVRIGVFRPERLRAARWLAGLMLGALLAQILVGGWLSTNYAAVACLDFPQCQGQWWPKADFAAGFNLFAERAGHYLGGQLDSLARTAIHMTHRLGALVLTGIFVLALSLLMRWGLAARWGMTLLVLLMLQLGLGIANIVMQVPVLVATAHNGLAGVLFALTLMLNDQLMRTDQASHPS